MFRLLGILLTVLFAIATAIMVWPQFFHLEQTFPFAQVVAVRGAVLAGLLAIAVLSLLLLFARPLRGFAASILIVALLGGAAIGGIGVMRGFGTGSLPEKTDESVRVLTWNTAGEAVSAETIADAILTQEVDVVTLPETAESVGERIAVMLREQGHPMWVHHVQFGDVPNGPQAWETTILISPDLGDYSVIGSSEDGTSNTSSVPSAVVMPVNGSGPTIVAVHAVAPRKEAMSRWQSDLRWIADQCPAGDVILAGDFNATIDHMAALGVNGGDVGNCRDAASRTGTGFTGTWPESFPELLGAPIDHVMASQNWQPTGSLVLDAAGSDHRALVVQLEPAG
ncbi:endonuclease/exonuclease/phosphatase family protein [Microbacterium murale]|uniref:Endonuclease/exonuclease/phosphatase (EEP) superfamily protein YafD n=1 Tax=Microbacterium murale TaxID=1081040 RepID=A0ABU0PCD2_9MICO|nr:endonuclease/exonuclease/phosphatase family protein [Microbacterium murale]MDQ0644988.1 endonuclease/exonuclease/phosphatase (EEP) superfamily protein YafD [Microbacterium murale]